MQHNLIDIMHGAGIGFHADVAKQLGHVQLIPVAIAFHVPHGIGDRVTRFNGRAERGHVDDRLGAGIVSLRTGWIANWTRHGVEGVVVMLLGRLQEA